LDAEDLKRYLCNFAVEGLFLVQDEKHRQLFQAISASCSKLFQNASDFIKGLIASLFNNFLSKSSNNFSNDAQLIYTLMEFNIGKQVLESLFVETAKALVDMLNKATLAIVDLNEASDKTELIAEMQILLKVIIGFLSKFSAHVKEGLSSSEPLGGLYVSVSSLFECAMSISQGTGFGIECKFLSGMLVCLLLNFSSEYDEVTARIVASKLFGLEATTHDESSRTLFKHLPSKMNIRTEIEKVTQLSILRGLLSNLRDQVLLTKLQTSEGSQYGRVVYFACPSVNDFLAT
jgi:hypothetical protein